MSAVSVRGAPSPRSALSFACFAPALLVLAPSAAGAQSYERGTYMQGPTRPMDGSPRRGVYAAQPAPSYERTPERLGYGSPARDRPPIWSGLYAGANGGYGWQNTKLDVLGLASLTRGGSRFGGHVGYNWQFANVVLGVESDLVRADTSAAATLGGVSALMAASWQSTIRARAGVTAGRALFYVTAGGAMSTQKVSVASPALTLSSTDQRFGTVYGAGVEVMVMPRISTRLEALRYDMREQSGIIGGGLKQSDNVIRAGVTFHFN